MGIIQLEANDEKWRDEQSERSDVDDGGGDEEVPRARS